MNGDRASLIRVALAEVKRTIAKAAILFVTQKICAQPSNSFRVITLAVSPTLLPADRPLVAQARPWGGIRQLRGPEPSTANYSLGSRLNRCGSSQLLKAPCPSRYRSQPKKTSFGQC